MRVLLLSLYYPPLNIIASSRCNAIVKYLKSEGADVDVITRYYDKDQQKGESMFLAGEEPTGFNQDYLRIENVLYTNFKKENNKIRLSKKLPPVIRGLYNYSNIDVFHYGWLDYMLNAYKKEFSKNKYDFIISSYGPPIMLLAARKLSEITGIPFIIDFRDSYIDEKDKGFHLFIKKKIQQKILLASSGIVFSTEGMKDFFNKKAGESLRKKSVCIVYNGIESERNLDEQLLERNIIEEFNAIKKNNDLVLLHTGTLYKGQNIEFFNDGLVKFNSTHNKKAALVFLGLAKNNFTLTKTPGLFYLPKVNHVTALYLQQKADALVLPVWDGRYTGFSGKTMEYLVSGNIVLCSPKPQNDMKDFFERSGNVHVLENYKMLEDTCLSIMEKKLERKPVVDRTVFERKYWVKNLFKFLTHLKSQ
jgi:hypothetical protein